ncbi:MAG: hypothetical protein ACXVO1_04765 [Tumebacillaceae bacterium]
MASAVSYCVGVISYTLHHVLLYPFLGGWIAGLLVMGGFRRQALEKT